MNKTEKFKIFLIAFFLGIGGGFVSYLVLPSKSNHYLAQGNTIEATNPNMKFTNLGSTGTITDFTTAAEIGKDAVVHIKTEYYNQGEDPVYNFFYGKPDKSSPIQGSGSGVIISTDGYIVTNNHVIDKATNIAVTLNDKKEYKAKVIGRDPSTDIALIKIEGTDLHSLAFGNSDDLKVGEWVLAIGNPFNLTSTVTAGIVSAKARNISILDKRYAIESFIQTDAAVNPGNSGGALINTNGQLIGINTAIASPTGSFTGYSFAIPVSIVKKVVQDLMEFGEVQRAFIGAKIVEIDDKIAQSYNLPNNKGVLISSVTPDGAAEEADLADGDVILKFDGVEINELPELLELIGRHRPGDKVIITFRRNNKTKDVELILKNVQGDAKNLVGNNSDVFGATFEDLSQEELSKFNLKYGVIVSDVSNGKFMSTGIRAGFVIVRINDKVVKNTKDLYEILNDIHGGVYIEGYYPENHTKAYYAFGVE